MLLEEFKDQYTLVIVLNFLILYAGNHLNDLMETIYIQANYKDFSNVFLSQFDLNDFFGNLGYAYLATIGLHLAIYKKNKKWLFRINAMLASLVLSYIWSLVSFESFIQILKKAHPFFILSVIGQFIFYVIVGNELFQSINFKRKQVEINHS